MVLSLSLLLIGLDNTVFKVTLPSLQTHLDTSGSTPAWIVDAYPLSSPPCTSPRDARRSLRPSPCAAERRAAVRRGQRGRLVRRLGRAAGRAARRDGSATAVKRSRSLPSLDAQST